MIGSRILHFYKSGSCTMYLYFDLAWSIHLCRLLTLCILDQYISMPLSWEALCFLKILCLVLGILRWSPYCSQAAVIRFTRYCISAFVFFQTEVSSTYRRVLMHTQFMIMPGASSDRSSLNIFLYVLMLQSNGDKEQLCRTRRLVSMFWELCFMTAYWFRYKFLLTICQ